MDVLLIQPRISRAKRLLSWQIGLVPPMMLLYLTRPLEALGFHTQVMDLTVYDISAKRLEHYIKINQPKVVGITCTTVSFSNALKIAAIVKQADTGIKVVMGGPHVTFQSKETLENSCVDVVVRGEGDHNFPMLVEHFMRQSHQLKDIKGISFQQGTEIIENPRAVVKDVRKVHYPLRDKVELNRYKIKGAIHAGRGCPAKCRFCSAGALSGGKYRVRTAESIKDEIDYLVKGLGLGYILFSDDTFTGFPEITYEICRHILDKGYNIHWVCGSRVDLPDMELLKMMARSGCQTIQFGFESGSAEILKAMNKNTTPAQIERAIRLCVEAGCRASGNFMMGFPEDTEKTIRETIDLAKKIKQMGAWVALSVLTPYPGTFYYKNAENIGLNILSDHWDDYDMEHPIISTKNLSVENLRRIYYDSRVELMRA